MSVHNLDVVHHSPTQERVFCHAILVLLCCFTLRSSSSQSFSLAQTQFYGIEAEIPQKYLTACIVEDIQLDA